MKKVVVVFDYIDGSIIGIYATRELAEKYNPKVPEEDIEEYTVWDE